MSDSTLVIEKVINASREDVFEAFTNPQIMNQWFYPDDYVSVEVECDLQIGGTFKLDTIDSTGRIFTIVGEYTEIVVPEKLVFTWSNELVEHSVVTVEFKDLDSRTQIVLSHEFLPEGMVKGIHDIGWNETLERFRNFFEN